MLLLEALLLEHSIAVWGQVWFIAAWARSSQAYPPFSDTGLWSLKIVALLLGKRLNLGIVSHL